MIGKVSAKFTSRSIGGVVGFGDVGKASMTNRRQSGGDTADHLVDYGRLCTHGRRF